MPQFNHSLIFSFTHFHLLTPNYFLIQQTALKYQLLAELLTTLEGEGFSFGLEEHLRWQRMLARLPDDLSAEQLKTIVCPLLATDETEQALVYQVFDESLARVKAINLANENATKKGWNTFIPWPWLLFWIAALATFIGILTYPVPERIPPREIDPTYATVAPGQTKQICIDQKKLADKPRMIGAQLVNRDVTESVIGTYEFKNKCLFYTAKNGKGADTIAVEFMELDGFRWYTTFYVIVDEIRMDTIEKPIAQKRINNNKALFFYKQYPFENDIRTLIVPPLSAIEEFYQKYAKWIKLLLAMAVIAILGKILLDREEKRKKLVAESAARQDALPLWQLSPNILDSTTTGTLFFNLLNKLRKRTPDDFYRLNIPKTVDKTIQKAGMVEFQYDQQTRPPEYILLVDGADHANHLSKLFELLIEHFKANEVYIERFFLHPDNELCYNEDFPKGMSLNGLQERFYNSKLLLLAANNEPKALFNKKLDHWKSAFDGWEAAALLLPIPAFATAKTDHQLQSIFELVPATMTGIDNLLDSQTGNRNRGRTIETEVDQVSEELSAKEGEIIPVLQKYFGEPITVWVAACAIYPTLHWSLTTHLGQLLDKGETPLMSLDNLFGLTSIPWFIQGAIPEEARGVLLEYLQKNHPRILDQLNTTISDLLTQEKLKEDGQIVDKQEAIIGVDKAILEKVEGDKSITKSESFANTGTTKSANFPVITKLDRKETVLDYIIPKKWQRELKQLGFPNLGNEEFWRDVVRWALPILIAALGFLWWLPEEWDNCDGELVEYVYEETPLTLCISKPEERILLNEYLARDAILLQEEAKVDSVNLATTKLLEANLPLTDAVNQANQSFLGNVAVEYFNRGVQFYNDYFQSNAASNKSDAVNTIKTEACYNFGRAVLFDSLDVDMVNAVEWCEKQKEPKTINLQGRVVDASNGLVLASAKVAFESQVTVTDSVGLFNFDVPQTVDSQLVKLTINKIGYLEKIGEYEVDKVDSNLVLIEIVSLQPDSATLKVYTINGQITDANTNQGPIVPINILIDKTLETIAKAGKFKLELAADRVSNGKVKLRIEGQGYQTIIQEIAFEENETININLEIEPILSDNFETIAAEDTDLLDSLDYLLNRILEINEAPTAINFDVPKPKMEFIEGSTFAMGDVMGDNSSDAALTHVVTLSSFYMGAYEVTFDEFDLFTDMTGDLPIGDAGWGRGRQPAFQVSWYQAIKYCNWLSEQLGYDKVYTIDENRQDPNNKNRQDRQKWTVIADWDANGFRLPTEAEWEYAARQGGEKLRFSNGKNIGNPTEINYAAIPDDNPEYLVNGVNRRQTVEVGTLPPNSEGLYEMSGNVPEWCWDWMGDYPNNAETNPTGAESGVVKILRGGSFAFPGEDAKAYSRYASSPTRVNGLGFRLCRSAK